MGASYPRDYYNPLFARRGFPKGLLVENCLDMNLEKVVVDFIYCDSIVLT